MMSEDQGLDIGIDLGTSSITVAYALRRSPEIWLLKFESDTAQKDSNELPASFARSEDTYHFGPNADAFKGCVLYEHIKLGITGRQPYRNKLLRDLHAANEKFGLRETPVSLLTQLLQHILKCLEAQVLEDPQFGELLADRSFKSLPTRCWITYPVRQNDALRISLAEAGLAVGIEDIDGVSESLAAGHFAVLKSGITFSTPSVVLLIDCGGGSTDAAVLLVEFANVQKRIRIVCATDGFSGGGQTVNEAFLTWLSREHSNVRDREDISAKFDSRKRAFDGIGVLRLTKDISLHPRDTMASFHEPLVSNITELLKTHVGAVAKGALLYARSPLTEPHIARANVGLGYLEDRDDKGNPFEGDKVEQAIGWVIRKGQAFGDESYVEYLKTVYRDEPGRPNHIIATPVYVTTDNFDESRIVENERIEWNCRITYPLDGVRRDLKNLGIAEATIPHDILFPPGSTQQVVEARFVCTFKQKGQLLWLDFSLKMKNELFPLRRTFLADAISADQSELKHHQWSTPRLDWLYRSKPGGKCHKRGRASTLEPETAEGGDQQRCSASHRQISITSEPDGETELPDSAVVVRRGMLQQDCAGAEMATTRLPVRGGMSIASLLAAGPSQVSSKSAARSSSSSDMQQTAPSLSRTTGEVEPRSNHLIQNLEKIANQTTSIDTLFLSSTLARIRTEGLEDSQRDKGIELLRKLLPAAESEEIIQSLNCPDHELDSDDDSHHISPSAIDELSSALETPEIFQLLPNPGNQLKKSLCDLPVAAEAIVQTQAWQPIGLRSAEAGKVTSLGKKATPIALPQDPTILPSRTFPK
ncbi:hypothetical protein FE257_004963 [Aspergillus nanangensis]|uniref:Uncharacterized protein n=1 Tax=Aspergillus nanangensis TaxID=2582783 RepID=A0AAD4GN03_ASPNN|nr:hypothetical protein FE257_004963 [Aspergillus nanangensis]